MNRFLRLPQVPIRSQAHTLSLESDDELMTGAGENSSVRSTASEINTLYDSSTQIDEPSESAATGVISTTTPPIRNLLQEESNRLRALEANQANAAAATPLSFFRKADALVLLDLLLTPPLLAVTYYGKDNIGATYACFALAPILILGRSVNHAVTARIRGRTHMLSTHVLLCVEQAVCAFTFLVTAAQLYSLTQECPCTSQDDEGYQQRNILRMSIASLLINAIDSVIDFIWVGEDFYYRWKHRPTPPQNA